MIPRKEVSKMIKVRILDRCEFCDGEAYVFVSEDVDARGGISYPFPPPILAASGKDFNRSIANIPIIGPGARKAKAHCQLNKSCRIGISQMVTTVTAKPVANWIVSAVPT